MREKIDMNGIHDVGGMHGFGPVQPEANESVFHHPWEGCVFAMVLGTPVRVPGGMRHAIETMQPADYLTSSYYEKWLHARIKGCIDAGVLTAAELEARIARLRDHPDTPLPRREDPDATRDILQRLRTTRSPRREVDIQAQFAIGDAVRVCNMHPPAHTRLPRYVRGKRGVVTRFYGVHDLQDTVPPGTDAPSYPVYAVRFEAQELWGASAEANGAVYLDMWERYLEPA